MTEILVNIGVLGAYAVSVVGINGLSKKIVKKSIKKEVEKKGIDTSTEEGAAAYNKIALKHKMLGATCTAMIGAGLGAGAAYAVNHADSIAGFADDKWNSLTGGGKDDCDCIGCNDVEVPVVTTEVDGVQITTF